MITRLIILTGLTGLLALPSRAAEFKASSAAEVAQALPGLHPGDTVVLADGPWTGQAITFNARGTADKPVTLRAQTPGKVIFTGSSSLVIDGEFVVVSGLLFKEGAGSGDGITLKGTHNRLTETAMTGGTYKFFVHVRGLENRVDHCYLDGKTSESPTFQVEAEGKPNHHRVDHNHFGPRPPLGRNGGETMRIGYSGQSMTNSSTLVELNLFDRCDGEIEIISSKSCDNIYRANTFLDCAGMLTLRHGNRCLVEGNFFLGHHKKASGGIRVIGEDHILINNYMDGLEKGGFWVTAGVPNSALNQYFQAKRCVIAFNTIVDCREPAIEVDAGFGTSGRSLRPENITIANNLFDMRKGETLLKGTEGEGFKWLGNFATSPGTALTHPGIMQAEWRMIIGPDKIARPAGAIPAEGNFPAVKTDVEGHPRKTPLQAGCWQLSDQPATIRPLTVADVGPSWMERTAGEKPGASRK